jgi:type IV pilus assembly protein PilC
MPVYIWKGLNRRKRSQKGEVEASDIKAAEAMLKKRGISDYKVKEKPKDLFANVSFMQPKITQKDVIVFCRQFSTMIDAGLPIIQCLDILSSQAENPRFRKNLKDIKESVESGETLAESMKKYPDQFDSLFVNMIAAGEAGGILDTILRRLSEHLEKAAKLKAKVKSAMVYPTITIVVAIAVVMVIMVFVIPVFQDMFASLGGQLPALTQMVVNMSNFIKGNVFFIIGGTVLFIVAFKKFYATEKGNAIIDDMMLKLPVFGLLLRTAGNKTVERTIYEVRTDISEGRTMAEPLAESGVFPPMVCQMISVGESTGALDIMLGKIADFYDDEVDEAVNNLTEMIEPMMMVFLGVVIGTLVVAMYLPIFTMAGAVSE